jgi:hypothetical protein
MKAYVQGSVHTIENATSTLKILSTATAPDPPKLSSAVFSNDGLKLSVTFDTTTDRGSTKISNYASSFGCSSILSFIGTSSTSCIW